MFLRFARYIQNQSKELRSLYALIIAGAFTFVVGFLWFYNMSHTSTLTAQVPIEHNTPFSSLVNQTKDQLATVLSSFSKVTAGEATGTMETASVVEDRIVTEISAEGMTLTPENIALAQEKFVSSTGTVVSVAEVDFQQPVQIVTTTTRAVGSTTSVR